MPRNEGAPDPTQNEQLQGGEYWGYPGTTPDTPIPTEEQRAAVQADTAEYTPPDAKIIERDARGNPTVYEKNGEQYFAKGSTPFEAGHRTLTEYHEARRSGLYYGVHPGADVPNESVIVYGYDGKPMARLTAEQMQGDGGSVPAQIAKAHPEMTKIAVKNLGERGGQDLYTPEEFAKRPPIDWQQAYEGKAWADATRGLNKYLTYAEEDKTPTLQLTKVVEDSVPYSRIAHLIDRDVYDKEVSRLKASVRLDDGAYVADNLFRELAPKAQEYLRKNGVEDFNKNYNQEVAEKVATKEEPFPYVLLAPGGEVGFITWMTPQEYKDFHDISKLSSAERTVLEALSFSYFPTTMATLTSQVGTGPSVPITIQSLSAGGKLREEYEKKSWGERALRELPYQVLQALAIYAVMSAASSEAPMSKSELLRQEAMYAAPGTPGSIAPAVAAYAAESATPSINWDGVLAQQMAGIESATAGSAAAQPLTDAQYLAYFTHLARERELAGTKIGNVTPYIVTLMAMTGKAKQKAGEQPTPANIAQIAVIELAKQKQQTNDIGEAIRATQKVVGEAIASGSYPVERVVVVSDDARQMAEQATAQAKEILPKLEVVAIPKDISEKKLAETRELLKTLEAERIVREKQLGTDRSEADLDSILINAGYNRYVLYKMSLQEKKNIVNYMWSSGKSQTRKYQGNVYGEVSTQPSREESIKALQRTREYTLSEIKSWESEKADAASKGYGPMEEKADKQIKKQKEDLSFIDKRLITIQEQSATQSNLKKVITGKKTLSLMASAIIAGVVASQGKAANAESVNATVKSKIESLAASLNLSKSQTANLMASATKQVTASSIQSMVQANTQASIKASAQSKIASQAQISQQAATQTQPASKAANQTQTSTMTATTIPTPTPPPPPPPIPTPPPPPPPILPKGKPKPTDEEKRLTLIGKTGVFTRRMGQLSGKDLWYVYYEPYGPGDMTTLLGEAPHGAQVITGKGSGYLTAQMLGGKPPKTPIRLEGGAVDPVIVPVKGGRGIRIYFEKDLTIKPRSPGSRQPRTRKARQKTIDLGAGIVRTKNRQHLRLS